MNRHFPHTKWNRGSKLFWLLVQRHLKGRNTTQIESEFSGDGLGLVPHVLACINACAAAEVSTYKLGYVVQEIRRDVVAYNLSLLFELARDWKTPEMYQPHQA